MDPRTDLLTGINFSDTTAYKADTQERLNNLFASIPPATGLPQVPSIQTGSGPVFNNGNNINIPELDEAALIRSQHMKAFEDAKKKQATISDASFYDQKNTRRYIDNQYGFNPNRDNEDFYAQDQGVIGNLATAIFQKLPLLTVSKLGQGVGFLAGLINPVNWFEDNYIAAASDNMFAQAFETLEDKVKNDWLPIYQEAADRDKGFFQRAFTDLNFWTDDFIDGAAFMASAFIPGAIVSKLGLGAKLLGTTQAISAARAAGASAEVLEGLAASAVRADRLMTTVLNTASESMFEAKGVKDKIYDQLIAEGKTHQEASQKAGAAAMESFLFNAATLSASNFWETGLFYKALGRNPEAKSALRRDFTNTSLDKPYELTKASSKIGRFLDSSFGYYAKKATQGIGVEGFYEENMQLAIERISGREDKNLLGQFFDQTIEAIKGEDIEASTAIGLGGIMGGLLGTGVSISQGEYGQEVGQQGALLEIINAARNNWVGAVDIYKKDENGNYVVDAAKMASVTFNQFKNSSILQKADELNDRNLRNIYKKQAFASFVSSHVQNGTFDLLKKQLAGEFKPEQLVAMGFDPNSNSREQLGEFLSYAEKVKTIRETLDRMPATDERDIFRKEIMFEKSTIMEAIKEETDKVGGRISELSTALGEPALSDSLVEALNTMIQKAAIYEGNKAKNPSNSVFYDQQATKIKRAVDRIEKENEEALKKVRKNKDGTYKFENEGRNQNVFYSEYIENLTKNASLSNALEETLYEFDKVNKGGEYIDNLIKEEREKIEAAQKEAIAKEEARKKEEQKANVAKQKAQEQAKNAPKDSPVDNPTQEPVVNETVQEISNDVTTQPVPKPVTQPPVDNTPAKSALDIEKMISPTSYIQASVLRSIISNLNKSFKSGVITAEEYERIATIANAKDPVGTGMDNEQEQIRDVALTMYYKQPLNDDQRSVYILHKEAVETELRNIKELVGLNDEEPSASDETQNTLTLTTTGPEGEVEPENTSKEVGIEPGQFDPETSLIEDEEIEEDLFSYLAFQSSLKTVTQEEDLDTNRIINDPYLKFKQKFLRTLLIDNGAKIASGEFAGVIAKDRAEFPRDQRAQNYLDNGGEYGRVLVITDKKGEPLYFDSDYNYITRSQFEALPEGSDKYQLLVYAITRNYWNENIEERIALASKRTGIDPAEAKEQYDAESDFLKLTDELTNRGFVARVQLSHAVPGAVRRSGEEVPAQGLLQNFNYNLEIVSGTKGDTHVFVDNRYLVNGALYAVVEQDNEPPFYVRLLPKKLIETDFFEDVIKLVNHTYNTEEDAQISASYLSNLLFLQRKKGQELLIKEAEGGKFKFVYVDPSKPFTDDVSQMADLLSKTRFNIDRQALDNNTFTAYFINEKGRLDTKVFTNYRDLIVKNTTTRQKPIIEDGKAVMRPVNTYLVFKKDQAVEELVDTLAGISTEVPQLKPAEKSPTESDNNATLTTTETPKKRKRIKGDFETPSDLDNLNDEMKRRDDDRLNLPEGLQARSINEQRALVGEDEIQKVNQMFGAEVVTNLSNVANAGVWGLWTQAGITLYKGAQEGTGYHEAWHRFSQLYLTQKQKRALYDEVRTRGLDFKSRDNRKLNTRTASDLDVEEFIADDFRDFALGKAPRLANRIQRNNIFRSIWNFLKEFFFGRVDVEKLYKQLYQGKLNNYRPSVKNSMWGKLNAGIYTEGGVQLFDTVKGSYYTSVLDAIVAQKLLAKNGSIINMRNNPTYAAEVYAMVRAEIYNSYYTPLFDRYEAGDESQLELLDDLTTLIENWPNIVRYHATHTKLGYYIDDDIMDVDVESIQTNDNEEENDDDIKTFSSEDREAYFEGKLFERGGNETNSSVSAPEEIRAIVRMLPSLSLVEGKWRPDVDVNGFPKLNEYSRTWNNLAYELSGSLSYAEMYRRLQDPKVQEKIPQAVELLRRIPNPQVEASTNDIIISTKFYSAFARDYIGIYSGTFLEETNKYYFVEETKRTADLIERNWNNNFLQHTEDTEFYKNDDIIYNENNDRYQLNNTKVFSYNMASPADRTYFMALLGIRLSPAALSNRAVAKILPTYLTKIQENINKRHQAGQIIFNSINDLKSTYKTKDQNVEGLKSLIKALSKAESAVSSENPSMSYTTAEGEMIYALSLRNFLSTSVNALNNVKSYDELKAIPEFAHYDVDNNPYLKYSLFINTMFDIRTGERRNTRIDGENRPIQLILGNYNGLKVTGENSTASSNTNLNTRQKLIFDINSLLTRGVIEIMRTESSASSFFVKLNSYNNKSFLPIATEEFSAGFSSPVFLNRMHNYLHAELHRMKYFAEETNVNEAVKEDSTKYHLFRDILSGVKGEKNAEDLKNKIKDEIKTKDIEVVIGDNLDAINARIKQFFSEQYKSVVQQMRIENIQATDIDEDLMLKYNNNASQLVRAFVANSFVLNTEYIMLFDGDLVYQKDYKDYFKRAKGDISTGKTPMVDTMFANYMRKYSKATFAGFLGSAHLNDYRTVRSAVIDDYKTTSSYADAGIMASNLKAVRPSITEEEIKKIVDKYNDITVGDGQGHITLDFYRQFLISIGNWNNQQEIAYQKELAWFRINYANNNPGYTEEQMKRDQDYLIKNEGITSYFPPLKIQYNGPIKSKGTFTKVMDKFSTAPLIPSMIKGTRWEQVNIDLIKNGIGYTKFASGTKKYKHPSIKMYKDGDVSLDFSNYNPSVHYLTFLKEQINTHADVKEESTFGSQVRKLIMANLFSKGASSEKNEKRLKSYIGLMSKLVSLEKDRLFEEIGLSIEQVDGKSRTIVKDIKRFVETVQQQVELRDLNDNIKDYIQYDKDTKNLRYPLEASLNRAQIQDVIMGIVDTRLRKLKINGDQLIQISSAGFESVDFKYKDQTEEEIRNNGTNGLKFYDLEKDSEGKATRITPMQIKTGLVGGFEKLLNLRHPQDNNPIGTLDRLNALLKDPEWRKSHRSSISMVGYRIPTQGLNSIESMEIVEFLPSVAGSVIMLPAEIVVKAGSDYDIDKMFVFRPSLNDDGTLVNDNQNLNRDKQKEAVTNDIISLFQELLSDPEMFEQLITPNNVDLIKPVVLDVTVALGKKQGWEAKKELEGKASPYQATQVLRYINNLRKFESLLSGKKLLGIFAVHNTFSQLIQQAGVKMNTTYANKTKKAKFFLLSPEERKQVLSEDGSKIDLSISTDVTGVLKQEYFSQLINATVDIGGDDFIGYVNLSYENVGVLCLLIHQGVPFSRALRFINHPVLVDYYSRLRAKAGIRNRPSIQADILTEMGESGLFYKETGKLNYRRLSATIQGIINNKNLSPDYAITENYLKKVGNKKDYNEWMSSLADPSKKASAKFADKLVFAYFLSLQEQAQGLNNFRSVLNYDTTKFGTPIDIVSSFVKERTITDPRGEEGLFDREEVNKVSNESVISPFSNKRLMWQIVSSIMPVGYNADFLTLAAEKVSKIFKKKDSARASKRMSNEFIEYIVKNYATRNSVPIGLIEQRLSKGQTSIARRLVQVKRAYPELVQRYTIFNRMRPNLPTSTSEKRENIEIQRIFENTTADQNRYIAEFRELINFSDPRYSPDQQLEIQTFFKDAALYAFLQSGFNKSNISFQELVPQEVMADLFNNALKDYNRLVATSRPLNTALIKDFIRKFESNNKSLFYRRGRYTPTWRGVDYSMSLSVPKQLRDTLPKYEVSKSDFPKRQTPITSPDKLLGNVEKKSYINTENQDRTQEIKDIFASTESFKQMLKLTVDETTKNKLIEAHIKIFDENTRDLDPRSQVSYFQLPSGLNEDQMMEILEDPTGKGKPYYKKLTISSFSDMLKYYDEYGDDVLDMEGETSLDSLINEFTRIDLDVNDQVSIEYKSITDLYSAYHGGEIEDEAELAAAEKLLKEYNLLNWTNPNQLSFLFAPTSVQREYTPENIQSLAPNEIFVFGSNEEGIHGKGAALTAKQKFGAKQGQARGLQGQSYAVVTKKDWRREKSSTLAEIGKEIEGMLLFARNNPQYRFLVTKIGSSLAGYTPAEIKSLFNKLKTIIPNNVILPKEYEVRDSTLDIEPNCS